MWRGVVWRNVAWRGLGRGGNESGGSLSQRLAADGGLEGLEAQVVRRNPEMTQLGLVRPHQIVVSLEEN